MVTSGFELLRKQQQNNSLGGQSPQGVSAFSRMQVPEEEDDPDSFGHKFASFSSYLKSLWDQSDLYYNSESAKRVQAGKKVAEGNILKDISGTIDYYKKTPVSQVAKDAGGLFGSIGSTVKDAASIKGTGGLIAQIPSSLLEMVQKPIEAFTGTVNDNGTAKPATPEQQAQNAMAAAGTAAMFITQAKLSKITAPGEITGQNIFQELRPMRIGKLGISAAQKQAAKVVGGNIASGAIAGAVGGAIGGVGQDNQAEQMISQAFAFAPITGIMSIFGIAPRMRELRKAKGEYITDTNADAASQIAAANAMKLDPRDNAAVLAQRVTHTVDKDDLVTAAITNQLDQKDGYVVEGVDKSLGAKLHNKLNPSLRESPNWVSKGDARVAELEGKPLPKGTYVAPGQLSNYRGGPFGTEVKFESPVDKLAYYAASKNPIKPKTQALIDDFVKQTGVTEAELKAHGEFIRWKANEAVKSGKLNPRTQPEIDELNNKAREKGKLLANSTPIGGKIEDNTGVKWVRLDEYRIATEDGKIIKPLNEDNTLLTIGRGKNENYLYQPFANLAQQDFQPNFNRDTFGTIRYHYSENTGNLLVAPDGSINAKDVELFKQYGFLPKEIVSHFGQEYRVDNFLKSGKISVRDPVTNKLKQVDPSELRRTSNSLIPEFKDLNDKVSGTKQGVLSQESFMDAMYGKYIEKFKENILSDEAEPYASFYQKFFYDAKIPEKDFNNVHTYFLSRLGDDVAKKVLEPHEVTIREALKSDITEVAANEFKDVVHDIENLATSNNLFFEAEGAGKYRLRFQDDGSTYKIVGNLENARKEINLLRQSKGWDQDGGYSGPIPTSIGNIGGLAQKFDTPKPAVPRIAQFLDESRAFGLMRVITPIGRRFEYMDNVLKTTLFPEFLNIQKKIIERRNVVSRDPLLKDLEQFGQKIMDIGGILSQDERGTVADNIETRSLAQIRNNYIGRAATPIEEAMAKEVLRSKNVGKVRDILYRAKMIDNNTIYGSPAFIKNMESIASDYHPDVVNAARQLALTLNSKIGKGSSGNLVLRLAFALEDPNTALDPIEHARLNNITPKMRMYRDAVSDWMDKASRILNIPAEESYLPSIINAVAGGADSKIPIEMAKELARTGLTPSGSLIRDPNMLIARYHAAIINHKVGYNEAVNKWEANVHGQLDGLMGSDREPIAKNLKAVMSDYARIMRGQPNMEDALHNGARRIADKLGISSPSANSVMSAMSLSSIALRPALALRDFYNVMGESYISFGHEFTKDFLANSTSDAVIKDMKRRNLLPESSTRQFVDPAASGDLLSQGRIGQQLRKQSELAFELSGQESAYEHANASIYRTSLNMAEKYLGKLQRNEVDKKTAYDKMGISSNYGPGLIKQIDDLVSQGKVAEAADLYGQANMRYISHVYGFYNNPTGWQSNFGRMMGQWGSWSANASSTMIDQFSKGTAKQIAGKVLRTGMFNKATTMVGAGLGLNLVSWQVSNPMNILPTEGPIPQVFGRMKEDYEFNNLGYGSILKNFADGFIPYYSFAKGWYDGMTRMGRGDILQGTVRGLGVPIKK
jgi:hypothetical protein